MSAHITINVDIIDTTLTHGRVSSRPTQSADRHSQRLETGDAEPGRKEPSEEREDGRAGHADAADVAEASGEEPARKDPGGLLH